MPYLRFSLTPLIAAGRALREGALDLLYPPRCLGCQRRVPAALPLCSTCLRRLERVHAVEVTARLEQLAQSEALFTSAFALWHFDTDGLLRTVQHAFKYQNRPRYAYDAGRWMGTALQDVLPGHVDAAVPVPLHRTRRLERGYNQSALLARGLGDRLGLPCRPGALVRSTPTRTQTHLSRARRWENVATAFTALPKIVHGRHCLLVDDVLTTGATVTAAARALRHAGASSVHLAALALAE